PPIGRFSGVDHWPVLGVDRGVEAILFPPLLTLDHRAMQHVSLVDARNCLHQESVRLLVGLQSPVESSHAEGMPEVRLPEHKTVLLGQPFAPPLELTLQVVIEQSLEDVPRDRNAGPSRKERPEDAL
ncbi:MAG: hypothetical protein U0807_15260, partial [Candidatus Binatia bacterium]